MSILVTGASGFLGQRVVEALLKDPATKSIVATDVIDPRYSLDARVTFIKADLYEEAAKVIQPGLNTAFLLHGIMSGGSESNFELGMRVNLDATRIVLDRLRETNAGLRVIFVSSCAVFGGELPPLITEKVVPNPQTSYGTQKAIVELLINDYSRRGFIDGVVIRYPTVVVRPGPPSSAASSFASGIIREPLAGEKAVLPVSKDLEIWVAATSNIVRNTILAGKVDTSKFGLSRIVNLPGVTVNVKQMLEILAEVAGEDKLKLVEAQEDPATERIVVSWPVRFDTTRAKELGFHADPGFKQAVVEYVNETSA